MRAPALAIILLGSASALDASSRAAPHWTQASDEAYRAHVDARDASLRSGDVATWASIAPDWRCAEVSRVGKLSEGGKFVCQARALAARRQRSSCVVYSFGVSGEVSFEVELLTGGALGPPGAERCELLAFDPTVGADDVAPRALAAAGARFFATGLFASSAAANPRWDRATLAELMARHGHAHLDLLKVDIEGAEVAVFEEMCAAADAARAADDDETARAAGVGALPFDQLLIEVHHGVPQSLALVRCLEAHGFALFSREENLHGPCCNAACPKSGIAHSELAFVRTASVRRGWRGANATLSAREQLVSDADAAYAAATAKRAAWVASLGGWRGAIERYRWFRDLDVDKLPVGQRRCRGPYYLWDLFEPVGWCAAARRTRPGVGVSGGALTVCSTPPRHHHQHGRTVNASKDSSEGGCALVVEGARDAEAVRADVARALGPCDAAAPHRTLVVDTTTDRAWDALVARACATADRALARDFDQAVLTLRVTPARGAEHVAHVIECAEESGFHIAHRELDTEYCTAHARGFPEATQPQIATFTLVSHAHRHRAHARGSGAFGSGGEALA